MGWTTGVTIIMARTLLDVVQKILSDGDSDEVNSVGDTIESMQVAKIVKEVHDNLVAEQDIQALRGLFQLEGLADTTRPNVMKLPDDVIEVSTIRYDVRDSSSPDPAFTEIPYIDPQYFLTRSAQLNESDSNTVAVKDLDTDTEYLVYTDKRPEFWTMFDDEYIIFDAYDSAQGATMHSSRTQAYGARYPELVIADSSTFSIPRAMVPQLEAEARELYWDIWKDGATPKINQVARRQRVRGQRLRHKARVDQEADRLPDYGRSPSRVRTRVKLN